MTTEFQSVPFSTLNSKEDKFLLLPISKMEPERYNRKKCQQLLSISNSPSLTFMGIEWMLTPISLKPRSSKTSWNTRSNNYTKSLMFWIKVLAKWRQPIILTITSSYKWGSRRYNRLTNFRWNSWTSPSPRETFSSSLRCSTRNPFRWRSRIWVVIREPILMNKMNPIVPLFLNQGPVTAVNRTHHKFLRWCKTSLELSNSRREPNPATKISNNTCSSSNR